MAAAHKISGVKTSKSALLSTAQGQIISSVPPALRRFWNFTQDMAKKFSRHLSKDRTKEMLDDVVREFRE